MKPIPRFSLFLVLLSISISVFGAFEPPTDSEIDELLANPRTAAAVFEDATGTEAAETLLRVYDRIVESDLGPMQQRYLIAFWTARITELLPRRELEVFSQVLIAGAPENLLLNVYAGLSVGGAGNNDFIDFITELAGDNDEYAEAIIHPERVLTLPVYTLLVSTIANSQTVPPPPNITTPIVIPGGGFTPVSPAPPPPQPPVPEPYDGQG